MSCIDSWFLAHKMLCVCVGRCMLAGMHIIAALVLVAEKKVVGVIEVYHV